MPTCKYISKTNAFAVMESHLLAQILQKKKIDVYPISDTSVAIEAHIGPSKVRSVIVIISNHDMKPGDTYMHPRRIRRADRKQ